MTDALPILAIVGVTGSGKNELAQAVARRTGATLISVDSRKVYRGMNIGTAKPSPELIREFDYGMIDCAEPNEYFSAERYARQARELIRQRLEARSPVIMVGGTGFYLDAFIHGLAELPEISLRTRERIVAMADERGWEELQDEATEIDPEFMGGVVRGDKTRVRRVLEVWIESGQRLSDMLQNQTLTPCPWKVLVLWQDVEREVAIARIERRVARMRESGLTDEVRGLLKSGISPKAPGMATVGYQEIVDYLDGDIGEDAAYERIVINTRRYAKRQATWFRHRRYVQRLGHYPVEPEHIKSLWEAAGQAE